MVQVLQVCKIVQHGFANGLSFANHTVPHSVMSRQLKESKIEQIIVSVCDTTSKNPRQSKKWS
jgi:hypothetical protein